MQARSTVPFRHGVREVCSTLPARRSEWSRFALAENRGSLPISSALRDLGRIFGGL